MSSASTIWKPNRYNLVIKNGFKVILPEFVIYDSNGFSFDLDYTSRMVFIALLMNDFVPDSYLWELSKSYQSIICNLRKLLRTYDLQINRVRKEGYCLHKGDLHA